MNKVILSGNIVRDCDLKFIPNSGKAVTKFTLAVTRPFKKDETDFINCVAFGKIAETIAQYTQKGSRILVEGNINIDNYTNKEGKKVYTTDIIVNSFEFIGAKKDTSASNQANNNNSFLEEVTPGSDEDFPF